MTSISTLGQQIDNNARLQFIQSQLAELQTQLASGKKAQLFVGLGTDGITSQRARADLSQIAAYQTNITLGLNTSSQMAQSMNEFTAQADIVLNNMTFQLQNGDIDIASLKQYATNGLKYLRELLNTKSGDRYLFAGSDAFTAPMDDTGASSTYMQSLFEQWKDGTITTDQLKSSYVSTPETTMGYSPALASGQVRNIYVRADINIDVDYTTLANNSGFKDVINAFALLDQFSLDKISLEPGDNSMTTQTAPGATPTDQRNNFFNLYEDLIKTAKNGLKEIRLQNENQQKVGLILNSINDNHTEDKNTLLSTIGDIENADTTDIAVKINALQIQLTAAYQVTAAMGNLSLTNFL